MADDMQNAAHRDLVKALGDAVALGDANAEWLGSAGWAEAVERVRSQRFPDVPRDEAFRAVGQLIGERYLASETGKLVLQSLQLVPPERLFVTLVPAMAERLRRGFTWNWEPAPSGGRLRVGGTRATPVPTTLGFFEVLMRQISPAARVRLGRVDPDQFELTFSW